MWNGNITGRIDSFSQKLRSSDSENSSLNTSSAKNIYVSNEQQYLPIDSNQKIIEQQRFIQSTSNQRQRDANIKIEEYPTQFLNSNINNHNISRPSLKSNHQEMKLLTSQMTRPSYQQINSHASFVQPQSYELASLNSRNILQRKLNTSSRKEINRSSDKLVVNERSPLKYSTQPDVATSFEHINNQNNSRQQSSRDYSFRQPQDLRQKELHLRKKQAQLQRKTRELQQQLDHQQIKTFKSVTHVPYYQKYIQYEPEVIMVPRQKVIEKNYVVENVVDYVPVVQEYTEGYDLIPQEVINHRLQYQLVEQQIVYLPRDHAWMGNSLEKGKMEHRKRRPQEFLKHAQNVYLKRQSRDKTMEKRLNSASKSNLLAPGYLERNLNEGKNHNIYNNTIRNNNHVVGSNLEQQRLNARIIQSPDNKQSAAHGTPFDEIQPSISFRDKMNTYNHLIDLYTNESSRKVQSNAQRKYKPTFHVTSEGRQKPL